jgi:hypothetical protein
MRNAPPQKIESMNLLSTELQDDCELFYQPAKNPVTIFCNLIVSAAIKAFYTTTIILESRTGQDWKDIIAAGKSSFEEFDTNFWCFLSTFYELQFDSRIQGCQHVRASFRCLEKT